MKTEAEIRELLSQMVTMQQNAISLGNMTDELWEHQTAQMEMLCWVLGIEFEDNDDT